MLIKLIKMLIIVMLFDDRMFSMCLDSMLNEDVTFMMCLDTMLVVFSNVFFDDNMFTTHLISVWSSR
jgi:hypothetical protein